MTNEGTIDRAVRIVLGLGLLSLVFVGPQSPLGYLGLVPLATVKSPSLCKSYIA